MIAKDYVSFETAKLLRKKGFDLEESYAYTDKGELLRFSDYGIRDFTNKDCDGYSKWEFPIEGVGSIVSAPTLQSAIQWLKEKGLVVLLDFEVDYDEGENGCRRYHEPLWYFFVYALSDRHQISDEDVPFESPEQAYEAGIKYCLDNLI